MADAIEDNRKEPEMSAQAKTRQTKRSRLAGNDNETIVVERTSNRRFRLAGNDNETIVVERTSNRRFRRATNDNETVIVS